jgi:hypothetical protein
MPPLFMKAVSLTLQAEGEAAPTEFHCNVRIAAIEASAGDVVTYEPLCEDGAYSESGPTSYALHLVGAQDWTGAVAGYGLARYLDDFEGKSAAFEYWPFGEVSAPTDDKPAKAGTCVLIAPNFGGEKSTYAEFDCVLPIVGKPTNVVAADGLAAQAADAAGELEAAV